MWRVVWRRSGQAMILAAAAFARPVQAQVAAENPTIAVADGAEQTAPPAAPRIAPARAGFIRSRLAPRAGLRSDELRELEAGAVVSRPMQWQPNDESRFVGGVSYVVVDAPPEVVLRQLSDYAALKHVLPRTRRSAVIARKKGQAVVELEQGNSLVSATYSVVIARQGSQVRFWLDASRPHDIKDTWGYFRAEPIDGRRSLVTVAALVDLGPGLARMLFESRVQNLVLATPARIREHVELPKFANK